MENGGQVQWRITADSNDFNRQVDQASRKINSLSDDMSTAERRGASSMSGLASAVSSVGRHFTDLAKSVASVSFRALETGATIAAGAIVALGTKGLDVANQLQTLQLQMNGLTKSTVLGNQALAAAYEYAQKSPFQTLDVAAATKTLLAFGMTVGDATGNLETLGNVSITTGVPIQALASMFGEVSAQGKLTNGIITQMTQNGISILPALQRQFGKTAQQVRDMAEDGEISFAQFRKAMESIVDPSILEQLNNTMPRQLDRLGGSVRKVALAFVGVSIDAQNGFQQATDGMNQAAVTFTKTLADALRAPNVLRAAQSVGNALTPLLVSLTNAITPIINGFAKMAEYLAKNKELAVPLFGLLLSGVGALSSQIPILGQYLGFLQGPIGLIIGLVGGLIATSPELRSGLIEAFKILGETVKDLQPVISQILGIFKESSKELGTALKPVLIALAEALSAVLKAVLPLVPIFTQTFVDALIAILPLLIPILETIADLANEFNKLSPDTKKLIVQMLLAGVAFSKFSDMIAPVVQISKVGEAFAKTTGLAKPFIAVGDRIGKVWGGITKFGRKDNPITAVQSTVESVSGLGGTMSKAQGAMDLVRSGLINMVILAAAIGALGYAMGLANEKIPNNLAEISGKLAVMAGTVVAFTVIAGVAGRLRISASSFANLIIVAATIGLLAEAMARANEKIPNNVAEFTRKMGLMAGTIVAIQLIAGVADRLRVDAKALLQVVGIAGVLVLVSEAIKRADEALPGNVKLFAKKMVGLVGAVAAIGTLAAVAGKLSGTIAPGLLTLLGIAGTLVLIGRAVKDVNQSVPAGVGDFAKKMANISIAVGVMSGLATVLGALVATGIGALIAGAGLLTIVAIAGSLVVIGRAIGDVNKQVPADVQGFKTKLDSVIDVVKHMLKADLGNVFGNVFKSINMGNVASIVNSYVGVAQNLNKIASINLNKDQIIEKINLIKDVVKAVASTDGETIATQIVRLAKDFVKMVDVKVISQVVDTYSNIAGTLLRIQTIPLNPASIIEKVNLIKDVIKTVAATDGETIATQIVRFAKDFIKMIDVQAIGKVVSTYHDIGNKLMEIQNLTLNQAIIKEKIAQLADVIKQVSYTGTDSWWQNLQRAANQFFDASAVDSAGKVVKTYAGIIDSMTAIQNLSLDIGKVKQKVADLTGVVKYVMSTDGGGGMFAAIGSFFAGGAINDQQVGMVQSIINKMTEIARTLNGMVSLGGNTMEKVRGVRNAIYEVGQINEVPSIGYKEWILGVSQSILNKMSGFSQTLNNMVSLGGNSLEKIAQTRNAIYQIGQINEVPGMANKEWIVGMAQSMLNKFTGFVQTANAMPMLAEGKLTAIQGIRHAIWEVGQINQNVGDIAAKEAIVAGAVRMIKQLAEFATAANAAPALTGQLATAGIGIVNQFISGINAAAPNIAPAAANMQGVLWRTIQSKFADEYAQGMAIVGQFANGVRAATPALFSAGQAIQSAIWQAIQVRFGDMYQQGYYLALQVGNGARAAAGTLYSAGNAVQGSFWRGIQDKFGDEYHQGRALVAQVINGINSNTGGAYGAGANAVQGFINGANSKDTYSTGWQVANRFLQGLKDRGRQGSPWRETLTIGNFAMAGLIKGIEGGRNALLDTANSVVDSVLDVFNLGDVNMTPKLALAPVVDSTATLGGSSIPTSAFDIAGQQVSNVENHIGTITIASDVDAENWLQKLTRQDEVTRTGLTSNV